MPVIVSYLSLMKDANLVRSLYLMPATMTDVFNPC